MAGNRDAASTQGVETSGGQRVQVEAGMQPTRQPDRGRWQQSRREDTGGQRLATALGWFSIGLGLAEVAMPRRLAKFLGIEDRPILLRALGAREIATGIGILTQPRPAGWFWARVGGDLMDLALLGTALASPRTNRGTLAAATAAVAGVTVLDARSAIEPTGRRHPLAEERHHQPLARGSLSILARLREPAPLHEAPRIGACDRSRPIPLGRTSARWHDGRVGRRTDRRPPQ